MALLIPILFALLGAVIGALINWAIYQWAMTQHRPISPWMKPRLDLVGEEDAAKLNTMQPRSGLDFVPIVGWLRLRREGNVHGNWAWIRPLLIEVAWMIGLPWFWFWQHGGGLLGDQYAILIPGMVTEYADNVTIWFWMHATLIALMVIATFIDFDERMIPDQITIPGTVLALLIAAIWPESRLTLDIAAKAGPAFEHVHYATRQINRAVIPGGWYTTVPALLSCIGIWLVWGWGLLPKIIPDGRFKLGLFGSMKIMLASIRRPARKTDCAIRTTTRKPFWITVPFIALAIGGSILLAIVWGFLPDTNKLSLVSAFIGMGCAGGLIWGIRIVGSVVMGQEAMGFGDVTLMAMIGAFLGWQASLAGFVYAMFFAVGFAILLFIITRDSYLAFGPYLCMGALTALLTWPGTWKTFAPTVFFLGPWLLIVGAVSLFLIAVLLPMVRWLKEKALGV